MELSTRVHSVLRFASSALIASAWLVSESPAYAQAAQTAPAAQATPARPPTQAKKPQTRKPKPAPEKQVAVKRPPLTKEQVEEHWKSRNQELFVNELRLRGLAFEPEEIWLKDLPRSTGVPASDVAEMAAALGSVLATAPDTDAVAREGPELLTKLKTAAQNRSESEIEPLVHPELLRNKARVYDLFDTANYRNHSLGKFSPQEYRRVGVQFFQLTTSQVERLHYVVFSTHKGKIVVRDVVTGPEVARLFLQDEQKLALSKLELVFRALNDGDEAALKLLCTPGLYTSMMELAGDAKSAGARITRGFQLAQINPVASVPLDSKSIRVVVRVSYTTRMGKRLEYDIDFERIANDLKVVRLRDPDNRVIAWDPDIDNFLNRRYGLPDGPRLTDIPRSDRILPLSMMYEAFMRAVEDRTAPKIQEYAEEFLESEATTGTGYGMRAAAHHIRGNYGEAEKDAALAISRGGTVYIPVMRHMLWKSKQLWPVVLAISSTKIDYLPASADGLAAEEIPLASVKKVKIESVGGAMSIAGLKKARPFLNLEFQSVGANGKKDDKTYNFAAAGTVCPGETNLTDRTQLVPFAGGTICSSEQVPVAPQQSRTRLPFGGSNSNASSIPMMVPRNWANDLNVVIRTLEMAQREAAKSASKTK